jgi:UDP-2-acetamido-3-amino-2,3-dideoxy-glucuronate N-acetyltransferase
VDAPPSWNSPGGGQTGTKPSRRRLRGQRASDHDSNRLHRGRAWGRNLVRNFHDLRSLAAVCDASPGTIQELTQKHPDLRYTSSVDDILADPSIDAVAIAPPAETHGYLARRALEAGIDVFVEKPLCLALDEGRDLVAFAERAGRMLMVGHLLCYHPAVLRLREFVDAGEVRRTQHIYSSRLNLGRIR